ncbi:hypothetical protein NDU88_001228 [Pleurodeles waltl]|uniref:Uncharacterized protein n=1 Tax=Pleurodeles waltl TaxID=8319 RepID=A0AAV7RAD1_PLEWA|nr:hypothetical protein NDU88_001228 [Pleurodeles waltl]
MSMALLDGGAVMQQMKSFVVGSQLAWDAFWVHHPDIEESPPNNGEATNGEESVKRQDLTPFWDEADLDKLPGPRQVALRNIGRLSGTGGRGRVLELCSGWHLRQPKAPLKSSLQVLAEQEVVGSARRQEALDIPEFGTLDREWFDSAVRQEALDIPEFGTLDREWFDSAVRQEALDIPEFGTLDREWFDSAVRQEALDIPEFGTLDAQNLCPSFACFCWMWRRLLGFEGSWALVPAVSSVKDVKYIPGF